MQSGKMINRLLLVLASVALGLSTSGCGTPFWLPPAHKIEVQQGNLISESQRQSFEVGSTREQVLAALGQPVANNLFHADRWDYLYTKGPAGTLITARKLTVHFEGDRVVKIDDNHNEVSGELPRKRPWWKRLVG